MKHRIFVALPISERLQQEIISWEKKFRDLPVRWLEGKNLHITLVPPLYVDNRELEDIENALQEAAGGGAFEIKFKRVAFGPDRIWQTHRKPPRPRLIWAEGETPRELIELQETICEILGKKPEKRPLKLHLTIARFRSENFSSFPVKKLDEKVDWRDKLEQVVLFESLLSREGADYQILSEVPL